MKYVTTVEDREYVIEFNDDRTLQVDGTAKQVDFVYLEGKSLVSLLLGSCTFEAIVEERDGSYQILLNGKLYNIQVQDERARRLAGSARGGAMESGELTLKAPMPGLIVSVAVEEGQEIHAGQVVVVLESMKMQNPLKAPRAGVVSRIRVQAAQTVEQGAPLLTIG